jgi:hypothetical protein
MSNIDFDFILKQEGFETEGYVPDAENSKSGVTIASGFDLGARVLEDLKGLPNDIVELLTPFLSLKGAEAQEVASNLKVSNDQAKIINEFAKSEAITNLKTKWETSTGKSFDDLSTEQATVLASVAFQYGDLEKRTPNFWKQTTSGDWVSAYKNLLKFGDRYDSRRISEANYLFPALKKSIEDGTSTGILSNEAQDAMTNVLESNPEYKEIADTVLNTKGTPIGEFVDSAIDTVGNAIDGIREYNTQAEENAKIIPELIEGYQEIDKETEAMGQKFETDSAKDFINNIEPPQLWNLDYATPYDQEDLDQIANVTYKRQQDLKKKFTLGDATKGAYEDEMIATNLYKQFSREDLAPDVNFVLSQELLDELSTDLPDDYREEFAHAHSLAHAQQIREQLLKHLELEDKINSQGVGKGTMLRLLAAFTDPAAWTAIIATDGLLAPVVALQKSARAYRILRKAGAGAVSIGAIETYLASQRPDLDIDNVMHGVMTGAFLGGLFGIRRPRVTNTNFTKQFKDTMDESDTKLIRDDGGFEPPPSNNSNLIPGPNNPNPLKPNGERTFDWYDPNYDLALHTTKRADGRFEVRMIENQSGKPDELIMQVNKDGTIEVRKCK